ncbi:hypothetical protein BV898_08728 [Hypsibius exemplaris]|uniref:Transposase Tc1-like domain-containing protein n=1 Tax=Hypsibius exemplaris TaxID=2072580 RepID=A0A1W0WPL0_HYPEX|nr:hypothetical protein BV898_08728 [Hypsibius exemplaris]
MGVHGNMNGKTKNFEAFAFEIFVSRGGKMVFGKVCAPEVARAVHRLRGENKTLKQVASYFGFGDEWARRILLNYDGETGQPKFQPGTPGRPRKTTAEQDAKMVEMMTPGSGTEKASSGQIATALKVSGTEISSSTIRRRLRDSEKNPTKLRREKKEAARKKAATKTLKKEGLPVTDSTIRGTIKGFQEKHKTLCTRISKKKERKIMKSHLRAEKTAKQVADQMDTLPAPGTSSGKGKPSSSTDVEMNS